jgi:hypothetical protein
VESAHREGDQTTRSFSIGAATVLWPADEYVPSRGKCPAVPII